MGIKINLICRLNNKLNCEQKIYLYKSIVEPYINYCATVLFLSSEVDIERIQVLQNRVMRNILRMNRFTSKDVLLDILNFFSIKQKIYFNAMLSIFKIINDLWPSYLRNKIVCNNVNEYKRKLRNRNDFQLNAIKTCSQNLLFYKVLRYFNGLSNEIKEEKNVKRFKKLLAEFIRNNIN